MDVPITLQCLEPLFIINGCSPTAAMHLLDLITGGDGRLTLGAEGTVTAGFGGHTGGNPSLNVKSLFLGAGHISPLKVDHGLSLGFTGSWAWSI